MRMSRKRLSDNRGAVGVVLLTVAVAGLAAYTLLHSPGASEASTALNTPYYSATTSPATAEVFRPVKASRGRKTPVALVIGDSYSAAGGATALSKGYPMVLGRALHWTVRIYSTSGGGYAKKGTKGADLLALFNQSVVDKVYPDVIVVQAGLNDVSADAPAVAEAAFSFAQAATSLGVPVVVVGPFWVETETLTSKARRSIISTAWASVPHSIYLDPEAEGWADFKTVDGRHPNDAGHALIASKIEAGMKAAGLLH